MGYSAGINEANDIIYGVHPVAEALKNLRFALDINTLMVLNTSLFGGWCAV